MKRTFLQTFLVLFLFEVVLHLSCFGNFSFSDFVITILFQCINSIFIVIITTRSKRIWLNTFLHKLILSVLGILYGAEIICYQLYASFFTYKAIVFKTALVDGKAVIGSAIWNNLVPILVILLGIGVLFYKKNLKITQISLKEMSFFIAVFLIMNVANFTLINYLDSSSYESYKNVYYNLGDDVLAIRKFGLITGLKNNVVRSLTGKREEVLKSYDILDRNGSQLSKNIEKNTKQYNTTYIDYDRLINTETNNEIKALHEYFNYQENTEKNEYTGMYKDKNVIFILAESLDEISIREDVTPTLSKMTKSGFFFSNYYSPVYRGGTADGEYMAEWGLLPVLNDYYSLIDFVGIEDPYLLPFVFKNKGYKTYAYHNYFGYYNYRSSYFKKYNFDKVRFCDDGLNQYCGSFHASDVDMIDQTVEDFTSGEKFFTYYITLSQHCNYDSSNFIVKKQYDKVRHLNMSEDAKNFLATAVDYDEAMALLLKKLEEKNLLKDTIIVVTSDHPAYSLSRSALTEISKYDRLDFFEKNRGTFFIYDASLGKQINIDKVSMNTDVLPTVLNLIGQDFESKLIIGKDILSNSEGIAIFKDQSFVTNFGRYNQTTKQFYKTTNQELDSNYVNRISNIVYERQTISEKIQALDYYKYVLK